MRIEKAKKSKLVLMFLSLIFTIALLTTATFGAFSASATATGNITFVLAEPNLTLTNVSLGSIAPGFTKTSQYNITYTSDTSNGGAALDRGDINVRFKVNSITLGGVDVTGSISSYAIIVYQTGSGYQWTAGSGNIYTWQTTAGVNAPLTFSATKNGVTPLNIQMTGATGADGGFRTNAVAGADFKTYQGKDLVLNITMQWKYASDANWPASWTN